MEENGDGGFLVQSDDTCFPYNVHPVELCVLDIEVKVWSENIIRSVLRVPDIRLSIEEIKSTSECVV